MEIIDTHHHLWDTRVLRYRLFDTLPVLNRPFTVADFEPVAAAAGVSRSVCVEAASAGADGTAELWWLRQQADQSAVVARLVVWAPLGRADCRPYFDMLAAHQDERIVGVRRSFEFEPPDFPARPEVIAGARMAGRRGYTVDLVLFHDALPAVQELVRACPEVLFVLDHLGKPRVRAGLQEPWRGQIAALARLDNVVCKLSGLTTEADHGDWTSDALQPYIEHVIACFGWERVMFGSDWPVCLLAGGYDRWLNTLRTAVAGGSAAEQEALFSGTARRVYRLPCAGMDHMISRS